MNRIWEALKVIPLAAWLVVAVIWVGMAAVVLLEVVPGQHLSGGQDWAEMIVVGSFLPVFFSAHVLLVGYINADARRRGMRYVLWTLLALFVPFTVGVLIYFLMRDGLMRECPRCSTMVSGKFAFCAKCGNALTETCSNCRRAVEPGWSHCPGCGNGLRAG